MFIENSKRSYTRSGEQTTGRARFLILVSRGMIREYSTCTHCAGFGKRVAFAPDLGQEISAAKIVDCQYCEPIRCNACDAKGYTYNPAVDEHAKQCTPCKGSGYTGYTGQAYRYVHTKEIRAIVRKVSMHQCGHFMMGSARIGGKTISLSGSYGGDGLTVTVDQDIFDRAIPLPAELYEAWSKGGGWNSAGNEAPDMRTWALANLKALES